MATSPEIIHGTTPARDLFSFVPGDRTNCQSAVCFVRPFSTGGCALLSATWSLRSVGKLWMAVHKPERPANVIATVTGAFFRRALGRFTHYPKTGARPPGKLLNQRSKNDLAFLAEYRGGPGPSFIQTPDSRRARTWMVSCKPFYTAMSRSVLPCTTDVAAIEEAAETYVLKRMSTSESERFEEHLLACPRCQDAVAEFDLFLAAARSALAEYPDERPHRRGRKARAITASG